MGLDVPTIWNDAYGLLGHETRIASETEQTADARRARARWESVPLTYITKFQMPFTRAQETLSQLALTTVPTPWTYAFAIPSNCLMPRFFVDGAGDRQRLKYEVVFSAEAGTEVICAHEESPILAYTYARDDTSNWPSMTSEPMMYLLASKLSGTVGKKANDRNSLYQLYLTSGASAQIASRASENTDSQHRGRYGTAYGGWPMGNR